MFFFNDLKIYILKKRSISIIKHSIEYKIFIIKEL